MGIYYLGLNQWCSTKFKDSVVTFDYNNLNELEKVIVDHKPGTIKMEVSRNEIDIEYLKNVRSLCDKNGIILIFDECTSGLEKHLRLHEIWVNRLSYF